MKRRSLAVLSVLVAWFVAILAAPSGLAAEARKPCDCDLADCLASMVDEHRQRGWFGAGLAASEAAIRVSDVVPDGPADRAGLIPGDRILAIDGEPLPKDPRAFYSVMAKVHPGQRVRFTVQPEDGERKVVSIVAAEFPPELLQRSIGLHVLNLVHEHTAPEHQTLRSGGGAP